jgi:hypothetical protein
MPLRPSSEVSAADWLVEAAVDWVQLAVFGPPAFEAYARLRLTPDPFFSGQDENDIEQDEELGDLEQLRRLLGLLAPHTLTPDDGWFCVWDGHGELHPGAFSAQIYGAGTPVLPQYAPALPAEVVDGPKVVLPHRSHLLFRGPVMSLGDWDLPDPGPGWQRMGMPEPSYVWPADHAWCVAKDVDPHWAGIGADADVIDELIGDSVLDIVRADPAQRQPYYG